MKNIGISQRVEVIEKYAERRDCLDQRWSIFSENLECCPIPLANIHPKLVANYIKHLKLDAIFLSGGNSITSVDPLAKDLAPERDAFELTIVSEAIKQSIPIIGICRGMQILNVFFKGHLNPIKGHVAVRHEIFPSNNCQYSFPKSVNSYHNWSIKSKDIAKELTPLATDIDGNIEAFHHEKFKLLGIMWHPEREVPFNELDIQLFKEFLI